MIRATIGVSRFDIIKYMNTATIKNPNKESTDIFPPF
jgi:hypothetical protein